MAGRFVNKSVYNNVDKYVKYVDKVKLLKYNEFYAIVNQVFIGYPQNPHN